MIAEPPNFSAPAQVDPLLDTEENVDISARANVKRWQGLVSSAKTHFADDFNRMKMNMDFVAGFQWNNQQKMDYDKYIANFILRLIKHKVATLYARNPKTEWVRRARRDYMVWDGKLESLMQAVQVAQQTVMSGGVVDPHTQLLLNDFMEGKQWEQLVTNVGDTLKILYQYQIDTQEPEFKTQAKDAVDRTCVCGVSYVRVNLCRTGEQNELTQSTTKSPEVERVKKAKLILDQLNDGTLTMESAQVSSLKSLISSIGVTTGDDSAEYGGMSESIVFDFPTATSIIVDPRCKRLKGFVGAKWICEEFKVTLSEVNAIFGTKIQPGGDLKEYQAVDPNKPYARESDNQDNSGNDKKDPIVCLWEVFDITTKSRFIICEGYKDYVLPPETHEGINKTFWPVFALVFNSVETESGCKATIYPPSDVQLGKPQQKEWNRTRQALRGQRMANRPRYLYADGQVDQADAKKIATSDDNEVIPVKAAAGQSLDELFVPLKPAPIDKQVYDNNPVKEDLLLATGAQEANLGPAQANVTATNSTIAEQSRTLVASSNADDLDDWLTKVAEYTGALMIKNFSKDTVVAAVGRGAVWPESEQTRDLFCREILLVAVASSSGRPNKALNIQSWMQVAPLLQAAGANPFAMIEKTIEVFDSNVDPEDFFPIPLPPAQGGQLESTQAGVAEQGATQPQEQSPDSALGPMRGGAQMMPSGVEAMQAGDKTAVAA